MKLPCRIGLAPMAGYTDKVFRDIAYIMGACFAYTEMISAKSVLVSPDTVNEMLPVGEPRTAVQILGNDPEIISEAVLSIRNRVIWIDLNAGCPVKKVLKKDMGGALLRDLHRLKTIVKTLKENTNVPVSVKTRLGFEDVEIERIYSELVEAGVDLVAVHARTVKQGFKGSANWKALSRIVERPVPIFISGDIFSPEDAMRALDASGADGVLVARGGIGNPWIFEQIKEYERSGTYTIPKPGERLSLFREHLLRKAEIYGERKGVVEMRKFVSGYTKGLTDSRKFRTEFMKVERLKDALKLIDSYAKHLTSHRSLSTPNT